jgi:hypothetical protein
MKQSISHIISKILKQSVLQVKTVFWVKISMKFLNILFGFLIVGPLRFLFFISSFLLILNAIATDALSVQDAVRDRVVKRQNFGLIFRHVSEIFHVQRVSAKHGVKDDFAFLWEHAIFRHPPNKNPLTDRSEILHN